MKETMYIHYSAFREKFYVNEIFIMNPTLVLCQNAWEGKCLPWSNLMHNDTIPNVICLDRCLHSNQLLSSFHIAVPDLKNGITKQIDTYIISENFFVDHE